MQPNSGTQGAAPTTVAESSVESVLYGLMSIGRVLRQRVVGEEVDPGTFWLLKALSTGDGLRVTELAALANLDASTVSRHVQQLQRSGLIERTQDPADGRAQRVGLSGEGRTLLQESLARRRALLSQSLEGWDESDIETFDRLLARFVYNIENNVGTVKHTTELEQV